MPLSINISFNITLRNLDIGFKAEKKNQQIKKEYETLVYIMNFEQQTFLPEIFYFS